ncbi:hypothetical protein [Hymenobacter sublimis]|uniref:Uncharacterized protein n=1 Tax=Hymenobacter sublimis TaxID=2933777 RepID=A0ABY4J464_9BACT|nr:hypothetical protein [Hymenobacter sublimis]UPL47635.1 hypothetical protein MWH26_10540 [Hymenobacter sublimis]
MEESGYGEHFDGMDFDWFAVDTSGEIGLFASSGYGEIPLEVRRNFQAYDTITSGFILPRLGTSAVWKDYAWYGLFVYDWLHYSGPYIKQAEPVILSSRIHADLRKRILAIPGLPHLNVLFSTAREVVIQR